MSWMFRVIGRKIGAAVDAAMEKPEFRAAVEQHERVMDLVLATRAIARQDTDECTRCAVVADA